MSMGFDIDVESNMKYSENIEKIPRRPTDSPSWYERIMMMFKVLFNVVSINNKVFFEN